MVIWWRKHIGVFQYNTLDMACKGLCIKWVGGGVDQLKHPTWGGRVSMVREWRMRRPRDSTVIGQEDTPSEVGSYNTQFFMHIAAWMGSACLPVTVAPISIPEMAQMEYHGQQGATTDCTRSLDSKGKTCLDLFKCYEQGKVLSSL